MLSLLVVVAVVRVTLLVVAVRAAIALTLWEKTLAAAIAQKAALLFLKQFLVLL